MKLRILTLVTLIALAVTPAMALDLQSARASGVVAEKADGYVVAVKPGADVNALVADVNAKRRAEYARISKENGQPLNVVGKVAAEQVINNLPAGSLYQGPDGQMKKR